MVVLEYMCHYTIVVVFFKQKTAYEMRISDWSSDVCSSDLSRTTPSSLEREYPLNLFMIGDQELEMLSADQRIASVVLRDVDISYERSGQEPLLVVSNCSLTVGREEFVAVVGPSGCGKSTVRSEEHTSELQSLKRISYAFFCWKKKKKHIRRVYENITVTHIQINYIEFHDISIYEQQLYL